MKVLIVPKYGRYGDNASYLLTQSLVNMYQKNGIHTAVCAPQDCGITNTTIFPAPIVKYGFFEKPSKEPVKRYGEYLWVHKLTSSSYLEEDCKAIQEAITSFEPNFILDLGRIAALIIGRSKKIPVFSFVNGAMLKEKDEDPSILKGINETLYKNQVEQILHFNDIFTYAHSLFTFGPILTNPVADEEKVKRLGSMGYDLPYFKTKKVSIYLGDVNLKPTKMKKLIEDTFLGAPYPIEAYFNGSVDSHIQNITYLSSFNEERIIDSQVVIHDANEYIYNRCVCFNKPQIIVDDGSCLRHWVASGASRNGFAITIPEKELSVQTLYEAYRRILDDSYFQERTQEFSNQFKQLPTLNRLLTYY